MQQGKYALAQQQLQKILVSPDIDYDYEKLFLARVHEALSICAEKSNNPALASQSRYWMYINFPQLVPYSDVKANIRLHISGNPDKQVISRLQECNINWVTQPGILAPQANLQFSQSGKKKSVTYSVTDKNGSEIVKQQQYFYTDAGIAGLDLAYRFFNIEKDKDKE
jgi:hypothetical protein